MAHLHLVASFDSGDSGDSGAPGDHGDRGARPAPRPHRFPAIAGLAVAALMAIASLVGLTVPAIYAGETASWRAQGLGQDWVDLLIATPWLGLAAIGAWRGGRRSQLLLAGGLVYSAYSFAIYAFAVHFNALFLVYCATLGLSVYGLVALARDLVAADVPRWFDGREPRRAVAGLLMGSAAVFAALWLAQIIPALVRGAPPADLTETGLLSNPVHVLDLALVLPAMFASGWWLWRDRAPGHVAALALLGFAVLMDLNIAGLMIVMRLADLPAEPALAGVFVGLALVSATLLGLALRAVRPARAERAS